MGLLFIIIIGIVIGLAVFSRWARQNSDKIEKNSEMRGDAISWERMTILAILGVTLVLVLLQWLGVIRI